MKFDHGYTLMHEHITIDLSNGKGDDDCCLDCYEQTVKELQALYTFGVRTIVDVTNVGMGRNVPYVKKVAKETGIQILMSTGCYKEPFIPEPYKHYRIEQLAQFMIHEIEQGMDSTNETAMMIGEIGTSKDVWKDSERRLFDAAILAHKQTKKPIYTHTTLSTLAKEQAKYLIDHGVDPKKIIIGHMDLSNDIDHIKEVLALGVYIGFDTIGKHAYVDDYQRIAWLLALEKEGYQNQIVLSLDITRKSHLEAFGGVGYQHLFTTFLPALRRAGIAEASIDQMLCYNPMHIL